jgi:hypothetical protein
MKKTRTSSLSSPTGRLPKTQSEKVGVVRCDSPRWKALDSPAGEVRADASKTPKRYKTSLSLRQRRYLKNRMEGWFKYQSALDAGYSREMAKKAKEKIECSRLVRLALERWLKRECLSDGDLLVGDSDVGTT